MKMLKMLEVFYVKVGLLLILSVEGDDRKWIEHFQELFITISLLRI